MPRVPAGHQAAAVNAVLRGQRTTAQVAEQLGVSEKTVRAWIAAHKRAVVAQSVQGAELPAAPARAPAPQSKKAPPAPRAKPPEGGQQPAPDPKPPATPKSWKDGL